MQLQNLCSLRLNVEEDLVNELGKLPEDLADIYAQIFEHVERLAPQSRVIAERSLKWLLCQATELSEAEFLAAVSIGTERESVSITKETILFICGNLVMFDHALKVFRFAHLSVREYLETQSNFTLGAAHALGAEISLLICIQRHTELAAKYACIFRPYAFLFWRYHCQEAKKSGLCGRLHRLLEDFLHIREGTNLCYAKWVRSVHRLRRASNGMSDNWRVKSNKSKSTIWRVSSNVNKSKTWRVESDDESSDGTDDDLINGTLKEWRPAIDAGRSDSRLAEIAQEEDTILDAILGNRDYPYDPTFAACFLDLPEIVEQNLRSILSSPVKKVGDLAIADTDLCERRNVRQQTYLHVSCYSESSKLLRLLLQYRFPVRSKDRWRRTALHYAANPHGLVPLSPARQTGAVHVAHGQAIAAERVAMIDLLIKQASIIDAVDMNGETALHRASNANFCTEAQFLLEHGALVDARTHKVQTPLHLAVVSGHTAVARLLLQFKADIEARDATGKTPLLLVANSARSERTAVARLLLQFKADIEARDSTGKTPLLLAANSARSERTAVARLLLQFKANIEARDFDGRTPLLLAAKWGSTTIAQLLLQFKADIEARDSEERASLLLAAKLGYTAVTQLLLQSKADTEARDKDKMTPLHYAAELGHTVITRLLLQSKADIEARDPYGMTPLLLAAYYGKAAVAQLLLQFKADIEARDPNRSTPLFQTLMKGNIDTGRLLLRLGADINGKDKDGKTPLAASLAMRDEAMAQMLIDESTSIKVLGKSGSGDTMLHYAAASRLGAIVSRLLEMGAHTNETNVYGSTPLHVAVNPRFSFSKAGTAIDKAFHIVQLLVDAGADVEMSDDGGRTPLHLASQTADGASIQILLNRGANIQAEDSKGLLPLDHAAESGSLQVFSFLFKRWADVMEESSENAVESWLHVAVKPVIGGSAEVLREWRNMSIEDLVEWTTPGSNFQKTWAEKGPTGLGTSYRARLIVKEMRARRKPQSVILHHHRRHNPNSRWN